jgi:hypothetical protein
MPDPARDLQFAANLPYDAGKARSGLSSCVLSMSIITCSRPLPAQAHQQFQQHTRIDAAATG